MSGADELASEQAYLDFAYECLEVHRARAEAMAAEATGHGAKGGTFQARVERDVMWERMASRAAQLDVGNAALCFGRIDRDMDAGDEGGLDRLLTRAVAMSPAELAEAQEELGRLYIGRISVADTHQNQVVVDWRAPAAEPFYRATGTQPLGLARRRHFAVRGRQLLGIDDELFGSAAAALDRGQVQGYGALIEALESARSGKLSDIVATIQGEQDEIIRSPLPGVLVVQGGPGTGKTVVALHRAAYLLYAHRFPLEGQGVLVIGPNRLFLNYIDQVLPSLGEAGVHIAVLGDLVPEVTIAKWDHPEVARIKGDLRMVKVIQRAVRDRERGLRSDLRVPFGLQHLRMSAAQSRDIVDGVRRRVRTHNGGRRQIEAMVFDALARSAREPVSADLVRERVGRDLNVRAALEWMWPALTPAELLNDLLGSTALLHSAAAGTLSERELAVLFRPRSTPASEIVWTHSDAALLDEALELLGLDPRRKDRPGEVRTYGHIVVDEAQDVSPMDLRSISRRSLNGSLTVVGDIAQATSPWAVSSWDEICRHLPSKTEPQMRELVTGYRLPKPIMDLAADVLADVAPQIRPPVSIRESGDVPIVELVSDEHFGDALLAALARELDAVDQGSVAIVATAQWVSRCESVLRSGRVSFGRADRHGLDQQVTVVPVELVKGLELDSVIVIEPSAIVDSGPQGGQSLYVAVTRSTRRLSLLTVSPLPPFLRRWE